MTLFIKRPEACRYRPGRIDVSLFETIAAPLGSQPDVLFATSILPNRQLQLLKKTEWLARIFAQIADRQVRLQCIAQVEEAADQRCPSAVTIDGVAT